MADFFSVPPLRMPVGKGNGLPFKGQVKIHNTPKLPKTSKKKDK